MKAKRSKNDNGIAVTVKKQLIHFELKHPTARMVCIAGTFNDWHPEASRMISMGAGKWVKELELPAGAYEYRFVIDGEWTTDPRCARTTPNAFGETNSLLVVSSTGINGD